MVTSELQDLEKSFTNETLIINLFTSTKSLWEKMGGLAIGIASFKTALSLATGNIILGTRNSIGVGFSVLLYMLDRKNFGVCKTCKNPYHCRTGNWQVYGSKGEILCKRRAGIKQ